MQGTFKSRSWWSGSRALDILTFQIIFSHSHPCYFPACVFDNIHCLAVTCFFFSHSHAHTHTHTAQTSKNKMFKGDQNCPHHDITNENFYTARFNLLFNWGSASSCSAPTQPDTGIAAGNPHVSTLLFADSGKPSKRLLPGVSSHFQALNYRC